MIQQFSFWVCTQKNWKHDLKEVPYAHVHGSTVYNSQKVEATQIFTDGWMTK